MLLVEALFDDAVGALGFSTAVFFTAAATFAASIFLRFFISSAIGRSSSLSDMLQNVSCEREGFGMTAELEIVGCLLQN